MIEHQNTIIVIPARMASTRLPGKPLADINGLPMIVHVWKRAVEANVGQVLVAAAEIEIAEAIQAHGGDAIVTDPNLASGTDRIAEALALRDPQADVSLCRQSAGRSADHRTLWPSSAALRGLVNEPVDISTIAAEITDPADVANPNIVKAIAPLGRRARGRLSPAISCAVSAAEHAPPYWHHIGVYAFSARRSTASCRLPVSEPRPSASSNRCAPSTTA